jgi:predicted transposase YbfD/YdcC
LPHGIPSHDTLGRVFARLNAKIFAECFHEWTRQIATIAKGDVIAIDGKAVRHSFDTVAGQKALHVVSAWACRQRLVLEMEAVRDKSNEITAIPELLYCLDMEGCLVTIDAMGCQKEIAAQIYERKADYCLALEGNHPDLHNTVRNFFTRSPASEWRFDEGVLARPIEYWRCQSREKGHVRMETRRCYVARAATAWLTEEQLSAWPG